MADTTQWRLIVITQDALLPDAGAALPSILVTRGGADTDEADDSPDAVFEAAYDQYRATLVSWLRARTGDEALAEDVCQEAFARLLGELRAGRGPQHHMAWLRQVAWNLVISRARHAQVVQRKTPRLVEPDGGDPTGELAVQRERMAELRAAMGAIPGPQRTILLLALCGLSSAQTASRLGISEGAARTRLHRARRMLECRMDIA